MRRDVRNVLLVQLPIPPPGPEPIRGNVPLAAGYLALYARRQGLTDRYAIEIFPPRLANTHSDQGLVAAILARRPWLVGFTCYLWNIERTLWIASALKARDPAIQIILGGPEITADNLWVLHHHAVDFAAIGEGEQTFFELLSSLDEHPRPPKPIDGLFVRGQTLGLPAFRRPLPHLDAISSPYLEGLLDVADEEMLLLETIRGCIFKCKFCYYPKSYDDLYFLSREKLEANLQAAVRGGAREVVLLDPTLNQRKQFDDFLRLLADYNPDQQFTYFGELRAEGIQAETARLLKAANFSEVEIGLQSVSRQTQDLMDRRNNMKAFERGVTAMIDAGIDVKVDLIIGLPGDTPESIRQGFDYLLASQAFTSVQVFNLAILPGTAFRQEAAELGLSYQDRPPYYVGKTPALDGLAMYDLMVEAQDRFQIQFDPVPPPIMPPLVPAADGLVPAVQIDLDRSAAAAASSERHSADLLPAPHRQAQAFTLWLKASDFSLRESTSTQLVRQILTANPFTTLQVILEPGEPASLRDDFLEQLLRASHANPTYLDKFYAVMPNQGRPIGAKRLVVLLPGSRKGNLDPNWVSELGDFATVVWHGPRDDPAELEEHEYSVESLPSARPVCAG